MKEIAFITPPFTQFSFPYAATPFLAGTLNYFKIRNFQIDLGIDTALEFFSKKGITRLFSEIEKSRIAFPEALSFVQRKDLYINTIDSVINFLQGNNSALAYRIITRKYLPENKRFELLNEIELNEEDIFESARLLASLFIDDIYDLARITVLPYFGLSTYREKISVSANSFDEIYLSLDESDLIMEIMEEILSRSDFSKTYLVCITVPFPGNLYSALKISKWLKKFYPGIKIVLGGGYINTELKLLKDARIFEFADFITLDGGETPILSIIDYIDGKTSKKELCRTFISEGGFVKYYNDPAKKDIFGKELGTPDYCGLNLNKYFALTETTNLMHRLWSEKGFIKLRMAHGCYHKKCAFCDTKLSYIKDFKPMRSAELISQIKTIIKETGFTSFHFVDEAMPPSLVKQFCLELLREEINITWWGNIRFDAGFTADACRLMGDAGCIAVTGGLETANNRILKLIDKGMSIEECVRVCDNFSMSGILVHAYLIYGLPTETINETINSLEIIRQMYGESIIQSAYYHRFALTIHSPIAKNPDKFNISVKEKPPSPFANNDLDFIDNNNCNVDAIGESLQKALYNFNYGNCISDSIKNWFDIPDIKISVKKNFVAEIISKKGCSTDTGITVWIAGKPYIDEKRSDKNNKVVVFPQNVENLEYELPEALSKWILEIIDKVNIRNNENFKELKLHDLGETFPSTLGISFSEFLTNELWKDLKEIGLLIL